MTLIEQHDLKGFTEYLDTYQNTICGRLPLKLYLATIRATYPADPSLHVETRFLKYAQSERIMGESLKEAREDSSVSYAAGATWLRPLI
jgi:predicted class III extradiol MEMO1 family dioxygenase